ncbi:MAG: hypothetical protein GSR72_06795 [Desulfurococcales archaeon]|nr:hypothetical protein [Desulfurococcales archaeon]
MPTVHLSLPDKVYRDLKIKAAELGIQVTDLIKLYIRVGLNNGFLAPTNNTQSREIDMLAKKLDRIEKNTRVSLMKVEGKIRQLEEMFTYLHERLDYMDDILAQLTRNKMYKEALVERD